MALGAYSIVRYSDNFRDERVNLGVVVWHPTSGFEWRFLPTLERVKAVNPSAKPVALRRQIRMVEERLHNCATNGRELMDELSEWLKEGLEFSKPCPTRMTAARETATRLYDMLVPPPEIPQQQEASFRLKVGIALRDQLQLLAPESRFEDLGERFVAGVRVAVGFHARIRQTEMLWRAVSMRARANEDKIARAKSAAMDLLKLRGIADYNGYQHVVAIESPAQFAGGGLEESKRWIQDSGGAVVEVGNNNDLNSAIGEKLREA